jgi:hypothetical protein
MSEAVQFKIGLENGIEGRLLAWVLGHPGCFAYGADDQTALAATPAAIIGYATWIENHSNERWFDPGDIEIQVVDTWQVHY